MKLYDLAFACYVYGHIASDKAYLKLRNHRLNMRDAEDRKSLLNWLNKWGCRQFETSFRQKDVKRLGNWYEENERLLPRLEKTLSDLSPEELNNAEIVYGTLVNVPASRKTVGPTGAAKILFALRGNAFLMWDEAIRHGPPRYDGTPKSYKSFLQDTKQGLFELEQECKKSGISLSELPQTLGRQSSSLVKLIDEYNWVKLRKRCDPPALSTLEDWHQWASRTL